MLQQPEEILQHLDVQSQLQSATELIFFLLYLLHLQFEEKLAF